MSKEQKTVSKYKHAFLQLLSIITLYGSAIALLTILFQSINIYIPDPLEPFRAAESAKSMIRFNTSVLIVMFPVYVWSIWYLQKLYDKDESKKDSKIRSFLINLTLLVAGLVLIGNLIALLNSFLAGELTTRFLLKIVSIFVVIGSVFAYYLVENRKE